MDSSDSGYGQVAVSCEHGNESLGSEKCWVLIGQLRYYQLFNTMLHEISKRIIKIGLNFSLL
jgi:hypothetical protein